MRRGFLMVATAAAMMAGAASQGAAQQGVQIGVLECRGGENIGMIIGSTSRLGCLFNVPGQPPFRYIATVRKFGLDLGFTDQTALAWTVFAPSRGVGPGDLTGTYAGASGSASVGVGAGANVLIGGSGNTIQLQPVSLQGQVGLNLQVGLESIELRPGR
jgi:hypothetical protein